MIRYFHFTRKKGNPSEMYLKYDEDANKINCASMSCLSNKDSCVHLYTIAKSGNLLQKLKNNKCILSSEEIQRIVNTYEKKIHSGSPT